MLDNYCWLFSGKCPVGRSESDQRKTSFEKVAFQESLNRSNCDNYFGIGILGTQNPFILLHYLLGCWFLQPQLLWGYQFSRYCRVGGNGNRTSWNVIKIIVLNNIQLFFLNKHFLECCKLLVSLHCSEKINNFLTVIWCFCKRANFQFLLNYPRSVFQ